MLLSPFFGYYSHYITSGIKEQGSSLEGSGKQPDLASDIRLGKDAQHAQQVGKADDRLIQTSVAQSHEQQQSKLIGDRTTAQKKSEVSVPTQKTSTPVATSTGSERRHGEATVYSNKATYAQLFLVFLAFVIGVLVGRFVL